jgi:4,5-DOPA dioxygenase extradiol
MTMSDHPPVGVPPPILFVSHGAPTFALEPGNLGADLHKLGQTLLTSTTTTSTLISSSPPSSIRAILVISAHWQTSKSNSVTIMTHPSPPTLYDFGGFDDALYQLKYPASGPSQELVQRTVECLSKAGWNNVELDSKRGYDHGAWVPLLHLFPSHPNTTIPVFQISMPRDLTPSRAIELGQALAPLRYEAGVFIVGSGGTTHNLFEGLRNPMYAPPSPKAMEFAMWVRKCIRAKTMRRVW